MKIRSPGSGAPRLPGVARASRPGVAATRGSRAEAGAAPRTTQAASALAARLRGGEIAPREAIAAMVDETVARLGGASPALRAQLLKNLQRIAGEDPALLALLGRARR